MFYEPAGYDPQTPAPSYWQASAAPLPPFAPCASAVATDIAIIGAGYAGLNAALALASKGVRVTVLEAAQPGWGASGRNGGFCCLGGTLLSEQVIARRHGQDVAAEWAAYERRAIDHVRTALATHAIDAETSNPGELRLAHSLVAWRAMQAEGAHLLDRAALAAQGFGSAAYHGGCLAPEGFGLHPYRYVTGLAQAAGRAGVQIFGASPVTALSPSQGGWRLTTPVGRVQARQVLLATNGYTSEALVPALRGRLVPVISNIFVTDPIPAETRKRQGWQSTIMAYDTRRLLHYFRLLPDGRMLFGARGGMSFRGQDVTAFHRAARARFDTIFPHFAHVPTAYRWNGLVCLTTSGAPYMGALPGAPGLWAALGWHGNGVAAASLGGACIARAMLGDVQAVPVLARSLPPRAPFPRKLALRLGMALAAGRDGPMRAV